MDWSRIAITLTCICLACVTGVSPVIAEDAVADITREKTVWIPLQPGVSYHTIKPGTGDIRVKPDDHVVITYSACILGANEPFAYSEEGKSVSFQVGHATILKGIQEGVVGMLIGEIRELIIAPEKGFGSKAQEKVPANSTLTVEVTLVNIYAPVNVQVLSKGTGNRKAKAGDLISVNYVGKLLDGTVFDINDSAATPFRFGVDTNFVISGMNTGVIGMVAGEKRRVTIPPHFAYGNRETSKIPRNSTLIFEITCLSVEDGCIIKTVKESEGTIINDGQTGEFALRIETVAGKLLYDTQFEKPAKFLVSKGLDPIGIYYVVRGMREGEVRQATILPQLGYKPGNKAYGQALNVTADLIRIVPPKK